MARAAVMAGADVINDVSGGACDGDMIPTVRPASTPRASSDAVAGRRARGAYCHYAHEGRPDDYGLRG